MVPSPQPPLSSRLIRAGPPRLSGLVWAWLAVIGWLLSYVVLKAQGLPGLDVDSAELAYFAQSWQMGYGVRQPPLYTWLLLLFKPASWSWYAALEVARYTLLAAWLLGAHALARACGASRFAQALTLAAMLGMWMIIWRVHGSLTHTTLAAVLVTWGAVAIVRSFEHPLWWLAAGLFAGLACLGKFNAALWWGTSLVVAWWLLVRPFSKTALWPSSALFRSLGASLAGCLLMAAVVMPYAQWWQAQRMAPARLLQQIVRAQAHTPWWQAWVDLASGLLVYVALAPLLMMLVAACALRPPRASHAWGGLVGDRPVIQPASLGERWLMWQSLVALITTGIVITLTQGEALKPRWLWPVAPGLCVAMVLWAGRVAEAAPPPWRRMLVAVAMGSALLSLAASVARWWEPDFNAASCRACWTERPAAAMAGALHARHGPALRVITGETHLAGMLAATSPRLRTWDVSAKQVIAPIDFASGPEPCIAAWVDVDQAGAPPPEMRDLIARHGDGAAPRAMSWTLRGAPSRRFWLQSQALDARACAMARR